MFFEIVGLVLGLRWERLWYIVIIKIIVWVMFAMYVMIVLYCIVILVLGLRWFGLVINLFIKVIINGKNLVNDKEMLFVINIIWFIFLMLWNSEWWRNYKRVMMMNVVMYIRNFGYILRIVLLILFWWIFCFFGKFFVVMFRINRVVIMENILLLKYFILFVLI